MGEGTFEVMMTGIETWAKIASRPFLSERQAKTEQTCVRFRFG